MITRSIKTYSELITLPTFEERYRYLRLSGMVGMDTFGYDRYLNQALYQSQEWKSIRDFVIVRDNGCDLGIEDYKIHGRIYVHHMSPLIPQDFKVSSNFLLDPEYLICTTHATHNAIHYGDENIIAKGPIVRTKNDTCPWRRD